MFSTRASKNMEQDLDMPPLIGEDLPSVPTESVELDDSDFTDDEDCGAETACQEPTSCLFCQHVATTVEAAIAHVKTEHHIDLPQLKAKFQMDQYSFLRLINCIRCEGVSAEKLANAQEVFWSDDKYLKPKEYEPWLSYDYDELSIQNTNSEKSSTISNEVEHLRELVKSLEQKVKQQELMLDYAREDIKKMRGGFQRLLEKDNADLPDTPKLNCVGATSIRADEGYFSSYAHFGIHHEMLSDVVRTKTYRDALLKNTAYVSGKDVLDVGCGTSVLSIFASQAGANKVVGIDNSDIIYNAMDIVNKNKIQNVTLVKGRLEDTELPQKQYDIIISEWMGYFLLFEGMLDSVIYARNHHLKAGGMLLPNRCTISLLGYGNEALFKDHITFWDDVYGLDMSNMRKTVMQEPLVSIVSPEHILTEPNTIADYDLNTVDLNYSDFTFDFNLKCAKDGNLSAFVGYFDTFFDLPVPVMFSTSPRADPTHWKQVVFFVEQPKAVKTGDVVSGKLICKRSANSARSLDIIIEVFERKYSYYID